MLGNKFIGKKWFTIKVSVEDLQDELNKAENNGHTIFSVVARNTQDYLDEFVIISYISTGLVNHPLGEFSGIMETRMSRTAVVGN